MCSLARRSARRPLVWEGERRQMSPQPLPFHPPTRRKTGKKSVRLPLLTRVRKPKRSAHLAIAWLVARAGYTALSSGSASWKGGIASLT